MAQLWGSIWTVGCRDGSRSCQDQFKGLHFFPCRKIWFWISPPPGNKCSHQKNGCWSSHLTEKTSAKDNQKWQIQNWNDERQDFQRLFQPWFFSWLLLILTYYSWFHHPLVPWNKYISSGLVDENLINSSISRRDPERGLQSWFRPAKPETRNPKPTLKT